MKQTIIVTGPPGCGKTRNKNKLAKHFNLKNIEDDWEPRSPVPRETLILTNVPAEELRQKGHKNVFEFERIISRALT